jgi:hypothetical protein
MTSFDVNILLFQQGSGGVSIQTTKLQTSATLEVSEIKPQPAGGPQEVADGRRALQYSLNAEECTGSRQTGR